MNIRIIGNESYCNEIESMFLTGSNFNIYNLTNDVTFIKDDGSTLVVPTTDIIVSDGTNVELCQNIKTQNSNIALCVAFLKNDTTWLNKEWKSIDADRFFMKTYSNDYLIYKVYECYTQFQNL